MSNEPNPKNQKFRYFLKNEHIWFKINIIKAVQSQHQVQLEVWAVLLISLKVHKNVYVELLDDFISKQVVTCQMQVYNVFQVNFFLNFGPTVALNGGS